MSFADDQNQDDQDEIRSPRLRDYVNKLTEERDQFRDTATAAAAELAALRRERTFERAGVRLDDPKFRYFVKGYDGEESVEAIQAELTAAGLIAPPADRDTPPVEQQAFGRLAQVAAGASSAPPGQDFLARIAQSRNKRELDEVMAQARAAGVNKTTP